MAMTNVYTGSNGVLTLANESSPEGDHAKAVTDTYQTLTVGRVSEVHVRVDTLLEEFHEVGRRHPVSLHPGNVSISGTVGRAYVNGALLFLLLGRGASATQAPEPYPQPTFSMSITLNDPAVPGNSAALELKGVKFQNWAYVLPEDDFVMENLAFRALTVSVVDKEAPAGGGQAVAKAPPFPAAAAGA
jgi:hypothetical protein